MALKSMLENVQILYFLRTMKTWSFYSLMIALVIIA